MFISLLGVLGVKIIKKTMTYKQKKGKLKMNI